MLRKLKRHNLPRKQRKRLVSLCRESTLIENRLDFLIDQNGGASTISIVLLTAMRDATMRSKQQLSASHSTFGRHLYSVGFHKRSHENDFLAPEGFLLPVSTETVWTAIQKTLQEHLPAGVFHAWFRNTSLLSYDDTSAEIGVPNLFYKEWLAQRYADQITDAFEAVTNKRPTLSFRIAAEAFRKQRSEAEVDDANPVTASSLPSSTESPIGKTSLRRTPPVTLNPALRLEHCIAGHGNRVVLSAARNIVESPGEYTPFFISGPHGTGKTHILQGICLEALDRGMAVRYLTAEQFVMQFVRSVEDRKREAFRASFHTYRILAIDDLHIFGRGKKEATQEELLLIIDELTHAGIQVVCAAMSEPHTLEGVIPQLRARLGAGLSLRMQLPDAPMRRDLVRARAVTRGISLSDEVLDLVQQQTEGASARELDGLVNRLAALANFGREHLTPEIVAMTLEQTRPQPEPEVAARRVAVTMEQVLAATATFYHVTEEAIRGRGRTSGVLMARQAALYLSRELTDQALATIGLFFGRRSHATVLAAIRTAEKLLLDNERFSQDIRAIRKAILSAVC